MIVHLAADRSPRPAHAPGSAPASTKPRSDGDLRRPSQHGVRVEPAVAARRLRAMTVTLTHPMHDLRTGHAGGDRRRVPARRGHAPRGDVSLRRLLGRTCGRTAGCLLIVVVLQAVQTFATLTLPSLNADLINNGVLTGDNDYIWRIGAIMLAFSFVQIVFADHRRLVRRPGRDGLRSRRAPRPVPPGDRLLGPRGRQVRRTVADHPHHQRRAAGPDASSCWPPR